MSSLDNTFFILSIFSFFILFTYGHSRLHSSSADIQILAFTTRVPAQKWPLVFRSNGSLQILEIKGKYSVHIIRDLPLASPHMAPCCDSDWLPLDISLFLAVGNNFNAALMTVVAMLGTRAQLYVDSHTFTSAGSEWAHFKGVISLTVECKDLQQMLASIIFLLNFFSVISFLGEVQLLHRWGKDSKKKKKKVLGIFFFPFRF